VSILRAEEERVEPEKPYKLFGEFLKLKQKKGESKGATRSVA